MNMALSKGHFMVTLGLSLVTGTGLEGVFKVRQDGTKRRSMRSIIAMRTQASVVSGKASQSLLNLRHRHSHSSVPSTTHLLGSVSN